MERIDYLVDRYFNQQCTAAEKEELARWIAQQSEDSALREVLETAWKKHTDEPLMPDHVSARILASILNKSSVPVIDAPESRVIPLYSTTFWLRAAAVLAVVLGVGMIAYRWSRRIDAAQVATPGPVKKIVPGDVAPGGNTAVLTLGDGSTVVLENARNGSLGQQGDVQILKPASGKLVYQAANARTDQIVYNSITTPNGGQYQVELPDGTKVWLNAASSLRFPTAFVGPERRVTITGEVYFEVAKDAKKPFHVQTQDMDVTVLGTHFNVMAYPDEETVRTTLLEGKVTVGQAGRTVMLSPGQQAQLGRDRSGLNVVDGINIEEELAWKNGLFLFNDATMSDIMRQVSRWYDVEVIYEGGPPQGHFTGKLSRNTNLATMLRIFTLSEIRYRIDGKKLIIMR